MVAGLLVLKFAQIVVPNANETGVLAAKIDAIAKLQNTIAASLGRIEIAIENTKQETSTDPRKELANMGLSWTVDNFSNSLLSGDERATKLFLAGGQKVPPYLIARFIEHRFDPEIADILKSYKGQIDQAVCTNETLTMLGYDLSIWLRSNFIKTALKDPNKNAFYFSICDAREIRAHYQKQLKDTETRITEHDSRVREAASKRASCDENLKKKYLPLKPGLDTFEVARIAKQAYFEAYDTLRGPNMSDRLWMDIRVREMTAVSIDLRMNERSPPASRVSEMIAKGCNSANSAPSRENPARIKDFEEVLAMVPRG
jgi:hypothetical protein